MAVIVEDEPEAPRRGKGGGVFFAAVAIAVHLAGRAFDEGRIRGGRRRPDVASRSGSIVVRLDPAGQIDAARPCRDANPTSGLPGSFGLVPGNRIHPDQGHPQSQSRLPGNFAFLFNFNGMACRLGTVFLVSDRVAGVARATPTPGDRGLDDETPATPASGFDLGAGRLRDPGPSGPDSSDAPCSKWPWGYGDADFAPGRVDRPES